MSRLRVGVVGAGMVGQFAHIANLATNERCEVVALADLRPGLRADVAARYGIPRTYDTHRDLLADEEVEAVVVITRREATGPVVLDCLNASRHVLSEKPMAHSVTQAGVLVDAARAANVRYAIGFMKRFDAGVNVARDLVRQVLDSGEFGECTGVRAYSLHGRVGALAPLTTMTSEERPVGLSVWPLAPDWMPERARSNFAAFLNVHVHMLNLLRYVAPGTISVERADMRSQDHRSAALRLDGVECILEMRDWSDEPWTEGIEIDFTGGCLKLKLPAPFDPASVASVHLERGGAVADLTPAPTWAFAQQSKAFVDDILEGRQSVASGEDAVLDLVVAEEIARIALATGSM